MAFTESDNRIARVASQVLNISTKTNGLFVSV